MRAPVAKDPKILESLLAILIEVTGPICATIQEPPCLSHYVKVMYISIWSQKSGTNSHMPQTGSASFKLPSSL